MDILYHIMDKYINLHSKNGYTGLKKNTYLHSKNGYTSLKRDTYLHSKNGYIYYKWTHIDIVIIDD